MKEGYWINYRTKKFFEIYEHEYWIRDEKNAWNLGLTKLLISRFQDFRPSIDRDEFLLYIMKSAPVMRVRGYGVSVSFQFWAKSPVEPLDAIRKWARKNAGPLTFLNIMNYGGPGSVQLSYKDFPRRSGPKTKKGSEKN